MEKELKMSDEFAPVFTDEEIADDIRDLLSEESSTVEDSTDEPTDEVVDEIEEEVEEVEEDEEETETEEVVAEGEEPVAESEVEEPEVEVPDPKVAALEAQVEALTKLVGTLRGTAEGESTEVAESEAPRADFSEVFKDFDYDAVVDSKEGFVEFMSKMLETMHNSTLQSIYSNIPAVVTTHLAQQNSLQETRRAFYEAHPELESVKDYVGHVASEISKADPSKDIQTILNETAVQVKKNLGLTKVTETESAETPKPRPKKATLPGTKGTRKKTTKVSKQQSEIDELLDMDM